MTNLDTVLYYSGCLAWLCVVVKAYRMNFEWLGRDLRRLINGTVNTFRK